MKVLRYYDRHTLKMEDWPVPDIGEDEVLVETRACGICASDILDWYREPKAPTFLGHEPAGVIVKTGSSVQNLKVGDRVFVHHHVPCFVCRYCRAGEFSMCPDFRASHIYPGGFAEFIKVPGENVRKGLLLLPENVSFVEATLVEPLACCIQAFKRSLFKRGDTVLVVGAGFNGLALTQLARIYGAGAVLVSEPDPFRRELAFSLGVDAVIDPNQEDVAEVLKEQNKGYLADVVFVTPPFPKAIEGAINCLERGGRLLLYAPSQPGEKVSLEINSFYFSHLTIRASYSASPLDTREALSLLEKGLIKTDLLINCVLPFSQFQEAFWKVRNDKKVIKCVLTFEKKLVSEVGRTR
ncbi:alcohol dehydrogenase catalytic domain-containing protein [Thermatribacter velox]|uniref:Alcohol dehydrogenase catalytic domain-containing protein n=1 Tax=Thermatribacter velox TaxID=3039681 RepID=A0ABZ2Y9S8_9BACT